MDWDTFLNEQREQEYYGRLESFLEKEYAEKTVYPPREDLFSVFKLTPYETVKLVILGQDPYHQPGQAHGLSFSVRRGVKIPPSLRNIYKELKNDLGIEPPKHGFLEEWAREGVFLLNAVMSVEYDKAGSHQKKGWEAFTDRVIQHLNQHPEPLVFILWGAWAQSKETLITDKKHLIIKSAHPSPLAANNGFFESKPFSKANAFFKESGRTEINWQLSE